MGDEYVYSPRRHWRDWGEFMLHAGADLVIAHHPHVLQPIEFYEIENEDGTTREAMIAWSLGNFISSQRTVPRDAGVILNIEFEKAEGEKAFIKAVSYIPTWVRFVDTTGRHNIQVMTVHNILKAHANGEVTDFRAQDIPRVRAVHAETTRMLSGFEIPLYEMQNEYFILRRESAECAFGF
jgi:poly-gamma-glutamate synthesis protein (capsule biosynthesis protein)